MKNKLIILVFVLVGFSLSGQSANDDFEGQWKTEQGSTVTITKEGTVFGGTLIDKNLIVMKNLRFKGGEWKCVLIRPKDDAEVNATATIKDNTITFIAKKYFVTKTITWTKIATNE